MPSMPPARSSAPAHPSHVLCCGRRSTARAKTAILRDGVRLGGVSMLDSQVLEVAIGLVVMFFLLALASSSIVEAIAGVFNIRGRQLENAIKGLVSDPHHTLDVW